MKEMKLKLIAIAAISLLLIAGCSQKETAESAADKKAESMLQALNAGNYEEFSRDFSENMKQKLDAEYFIRLHNFIKEQSGEYIAKNRAFSKEEQGFMVFGYDCRFAKEDVLMTISLSSDLTKVEGVFFDSENMRKQIASNLKPA